MEEEKTDSGTYLLAATALSALINCLFAVEVRQFHAGLAQRPQILLKLSAFTPRGFWQSKRNRIDLLLTCMGITWVLLHFSVSLPAGALLRALRLKRFTYTFGYMGVILRFFTIAARNSTLKMLMLTVVMSVWRR